MAQNIYQTSPLVGQQPGVYIAPTVDRTDRLLQESGDQSFAVVLAATRGRIDKPMLVPAQKLQRYLGKPQILRKSNLNSTYLQLVEAFATGAAMAVAMRLSSSEAKNRYILVKHGTAANAIIAASETLPADNTWLLAIKMADCINEGVMVSISKGKNTEEVNLTIREHAYNSRGQQTNTGEILYELTGSTNPDALDSNNQSIFITDVAERYYGDWLSVTVNGRARAILENDAYHNSPVNWGVVPFLDTGTLQNANFTTAADKIRMTHLQYRYIMCDNSNTALVFALYQAAVANNRKMFAEVAGNLTPEAAIAWVKQFQFDAQQSMYVDWLWTPIKRQDMTQKNGLVLLSSVGQKIGYSCFRNGNTNAFGMPALNQPIAGSDFRMIGTNFTQIYAPSATQLAALAEARINPCIYEEYHNGSGYVWADSLSATAKTGISKLSSATEIIIWLKHYFGRYSKSHLQKPMAERIKKQKDEMEKVLTWAESSGWLAPSVSLGGKSFVYDAKRNERYPDDRMDWSFGVSIDGIVRQVVGHSEMYSVD